MLVVPYYICLGALLKLHPYLYYTCLQIFILVIDCISILLGHIHYNYKQTSNSFHLYNGKLVILYIYIICTCLP